MPRERERGREGKGHHVTAVKCTIQRLPHDSCHLPPGFASVAAVSNGDFHGFWPESSNCLNFFFGVPNRPEQTRPESRVARPNWTAGCPFFGQHDQVARFVYPSVPKVTKGQTMMPRLLPLSLPLLLFSLFLCLSFSLPAGGCFCLRPRC